METVVMLKAKDLKELIFGIQNIYNSTIKMVNHSVDDRVYSQPLSLCQISYAQNCNCVD